MRCDAMRCVSDSGSVGLTASTSGIVGSLLAGLHDERVGDAAMVMCDG
jgi:hypothetical protein